ncbi:DgyrCDS11660 [Dimorphilus gyrociliatus]|uniref:type I protein arginine methyltransferase n=1 Tax=Dimorphilus gyrociliatus TaxID=2664684 RepID=A0A7I8W414_9ANNE|nr:DgyrCDS11660 [Dimorphilus gyrociliatus]
MDYFKSYENLEVHRLMLADKSRMDAYQSFINENAALFSGKIVMDVGSGLGILSLFCAKAGAKKVYAVEGSEMAKMCETIIKDNNFSDTIQVIHKAVEDIQVSDIEKVDIIVSEWMGFYLLHESMLHSVLFARDTFLKDDGLIVPRIANIYLSPVELRDFKSKFDFWNNVYGFDFSSAGEAERNTTFGQAQIENIKAQDLLAEEQLVLSIDLKAATEEDLESIIGTFKFTFKKYGVIHGFALWFDCIFTDGENEETEVTLDTSPNSESTHWKQTIIPVPEAFLVEENGEVNCKLYLKRDGRSYRIELEHDLDS